MNKSRSCFFYSILLLLIFIIEGCTAFRPAPNPVLDAKAAAVAGELKVFNNHIETSKGTGWITLKIKNIPTRYKIAWAAVYPNKVRFTLLLTGIPVETVICSGRQIHLISHTGEHQPYSFNRTDPNFNEFLGIRIKASELIPVLLGRFAVRPFDDAFYSPRDEARQTVVLTKKWKPFRQTLVLNEQGLIKSVKLTDHARKPLYIMRIARYRSFDHDRIASKIEISDDTDRTLTLEVIHFKANTPVKESIFRLTANGS